MLPEGLGYRSQKIFEWCKGIQTHFLNNKYCIHWNFSQYPCSFTIILNLLQGCIYSVFWFSFQNLIASILKDNGIDSHQIEKIPLEMGSKKLMNLKILITYFVYYILLNDQAAFLVPYIKAKLLPLQ